ncbi:MAG TPA: DUF6335 family protein [Vicinamibacterales bacterium]|nr:DUF6335 family protein [Vicinamibacterales bacterium]
MAGRKRGRKQASGRRKTGRGSRPPARARSRAARRSKAARAGRRRAKAIKPRKVGRAAKAKATRRRPKAPPAGRAAAARRARAARPAAPPVTLGRSRRQLSDVERLGSPATLNDGRLQSSARAGHDELRSELIRHTETSPALAGGDIDAKWQDAAAVGDEAPGGDNPTPGQDRVDDIGKALGVQYRTDEELKGGDEITARDKHRWELDPASSDDWPHTTPRK